MKLFDILTEFHNWVTDKDFVWWPFSFLRPEAKELMTFKTTSLMTACFGTLAFVMFTVLAMANNAFTVDTALLTLLSCFISFFLWFNLITKPLWNRRARALQK